METTRTYSEALAPNGIFYRQYGYENPGLPLVMIMGYGGCLFSWPMGFIEQLSETRQVLIFDNRGTGRSSKLPTGCNLRMEHMASDLKDLLDFLDYPRAHLLGYSMGGCIALELARHFPEQCDRLILMSTTAGGALYTSSDPEVKERLANPRGSTFDEMFFDFFDLCMTAKAIDIHKALLEDICKNARPYPTPPRVLQPQLNAFRNFNASDFIGDLKQRTLVLHGLTDRIIKVENGRKLAEHIPNCQSKFFDNCGHCPHVEHESQVIALMDQFLT